jgi:hypothetical protein
MQNPTIKILFRLYGQMKAARIITRNSINQIQGLSKFRKSQGLNDLYFRIARILVWLTTLAASSKEDYGTERDVLPILTRAIYIYVFLDTRPFLDTEV